MSEVEVETLRKAAESIPDAERNPQMDLLLASFEGRREAVQLLESESEVSRVKGMLTYLRAASQGVMAMEMVPPHPALCRLVLQHTMVDKVFGPLVTSDPPWIPSGQLSPAKLLGALAAGTAMGCIHHDLKDMAIPLLEWPIHALWPELNMPAVFRQLAERNWVPFGAQAAGEAAAPAQAEMGAAPASSSITSEAAATRAALAAWLQQHCPEASLEDVREWALVAHMTTLDNVFMREHPTGDMARQVMHQYLKTCWHLMRSGRPGGAAHAYHLATHMLSGPYLGDVGGGVEDWERMADEGLAYCRQHRCWYPAAQILFRRGMLLTTRAGAAQRSRQISLQGQLPLTQRQQQAAVAKALQELPGMVAGMLEAEGKVKPWLPKPMMRLLSNCRRGLEEGLRSLRASGSVPLEDLVSAMRVKVKVNLKECACCKMQAVQLKLCSGCKSVAYCSRECQKVDWRVGHKEQCAALAAAKQNEQQQQQQS